MDDHSKNTFDVDREELITDFDTYEGSSLITDAMENLVSYVAEQKAQMLLKIAENCITESELTYSTTIRMDHTLREAGFTPSTLYCHPNAVKKIEASVAPTRNVFDTDEPYHCKVNNIEIHETNAIPENEGVMIAEEAFCGPVELNPISVRRPDGLVAFEITSGKTVNARFEYSE